MFSETRDSFVSSFPSGMPTALDSILKVTLSTGVRPDTVGGSPSQGWHFNSWLQGAYMALSGVHLCAGSFLC